MSFELLLVNLKSLLVNLCVSRKFAAFTREFLSLLLAKQQYELPLYCFSSMFPFGLKKQKKTGFLFTKGILSFLITNYFAAL
ncbi:hypothetical protein V3595_05100 [Bacillus sp. CFBP9009]